MKTSDRSLSRFNGFPTLAKPLKRLERPPAASTRLNPGVNERGRGGIGNTVIGLLVLGVVNNGLDHIQMDSFQKILIRGLILLAALIINVYVERLRERT